MAAKVKWDRGAWWVVTHHDGKRRRKRVGASRDDKREAEEIAKKINAALALGIFEPDKKTPEPVPFDRYARDWLRREVKLPIERGVGGALAPSTALLHERHVHRYLIPFFGDKDLRELRVTDVQAFYDRCLETGRPPSERSVEMVLATLRRILAQAEAHEEIARNPVEVWKRSRGRRRRSSFHRLDAQNVLTSEELQTLLATVRSRFREAYPLVLFLADTGARLGEASSLRWIDLDLEGGTARIARSFSGGRYVTVTKTGRERVLELSTRLREELASECPHIFGEDALVFPNETGGLLDPHNFRERVFRRAVKKAFGKYRRFTPHGLRHTFASLHMARGTNLKWIQAQGGWTSAKLLLDTYGHFLPTETTGYADALSGGPGRPYTAPVARRPRAPQRPSRKSRDGRRGSLAPRGGFEPPTRCLEGSRSIQLSYRGVAREASGGARRARAAGGSGRVDTLRRRS